MTHREYESLCFFAKCMVKKQLDYLKINILQPEDFVAESILNGFVSESKCKSIIVDLIYKEKYRLIAKIQSELKINKSSVKVCKCCNKEKDLSQFGKAYDKRYGLHYYRYKCKDCESDYYKSEVYKLNRSIYYKNNQEFRKKANIRAKEWNRANKSAKVGLL